jgi:hypothetical protein
MCSSNPRPLLRVGNVGQTGNAELQDLIFTTKGATAGVILVEWNLKAENSGSAGMWGELAEKVDCCVNRMC